VKKNRLLFIISCIVMVIGLLVVGCTETAGPGGDSEKVYELTFANQHPSENAMNKVVNEGWKKWIEKESGGRIKIKVLPAEQVAKAPDLYDAARTGTVDIACQMVSANPGRWPLTEVTQLPLIFDFPGSRASAMTNMALFEKYQEIQDEHEGVLVLGFHANGLSHVHTVGKPVKKLEDLRGLVLQTLGGEYGVATVNRLGASPETLLPGEMYDAMAKGVLDGNLLEWEGQVVFNLHELTNYSSRAGLYITTFIHVMNLDTFNSLPEDLQELFVGENGRRYFMLHGYNFDEEDIKFEQLIDEQLKARGGEGIYILPEEELSRWKEAVLPIWEKWVETATAKVGEEKARAILEDALKYAEEYGGYPNEVFPEGAEILGDWGAPGY
jgi:TRAP-type C4-dicarboxylate transport system substrate-binding protein